MPPWHGSPLNSTKTIEERPISASLNGVSCQAAGGVDSGGAEARSCCGRPRTVTPLGHGAGLTELSGRVDLVPRVESSVCSLQWPRSEGHSRGSAAWSPLRHAPTMGGGHEVPRPQPRSGSTTHVDAHPFGGERGSCYITRVTMPSALEVGLRRREAPYRTVNPVTSREERSEMGSKSNKPATPRQLPPSLLAPRPDRGRRAEYLEERLEEVA